MARVLIVDDEEENREALHTALADKNPDWIICEASNESEARLIVEQKLSNKEAVDVVLTDLVMTSEQSGMTLLQEIRRLDPLIMAILFTAKEKSLDRYRAFEYGAFDVVEKNILGTAAVREINIKTRAALRYREWSQRINFLGRYFDPRVFETIEKQPSLLTMQLRTVTICFWDIRGFSLMCEILKAHPTLIAGFLRDYCETAATTIFKNAGVLDKFIGDGVMALFGVLNPGDAGEREDALQAVRAACEFRDRFDSILSTWQSEWKLYAPQKIQIGLGCGIHTGEALVGNIGADFREQFTALGPHVNFASRVERRAESRQILISQSTEARIRDKINLETAGEINDIKNIPGTFSLYSVLDTPQLQL
jgi:class 3 adenylate cyclase/CheY-like chemotaxis protein